MLFSILLWMALWTSLAVGSDLLSDPTRPPASIATQPEIRERAATTTLDLRAVFYAEERRVAIINGRRLREDDRIGSARVVAISKDGVRLRRGDEIIELGLVSPEVKSPPEEAGLNEPRKPEVGRHGPPDLTRSRTALVCDSRRNRTCPVHWRVSDRRRRTAWRRPPE
jgi:hypothetical protein